MNKLIILFSFAFIISACNKSSSEVDSTPNQDLSSDSQPELVQVKKLPLGIKGKIDSIETELFMSSLDFPLPFYTYVPIDITISETLAVKGSSASFLMDEASLSLFVFPESVDTDSSAIASIQSLFEPIGGLEPVEGNTNQFYAPGSKERSISIEVGNKGKLYYYWIVGYPESYERKFVPRANVIKEEMAWRF